MLLETVDGVDALITRLDDRYPGCAVLWLTGYVSMWPQVLVLVARRLDATNAIAWLRMNGCWIKLVLVCSWCWLLSSGTAAGLSWCWVAIDGGCSVAQERLLR